MDNNAQNIKNMFDKIAYKYDFMNNLISFGLHKIVRKLALKKLSIKENSTVADLCCGTGEISNMLAKNKNVQKIYAVDFSKNMLEIAKKKKKSEKIEYLIGDCEKLSFNDNFFDDATMCFGLRNIENKNAAISEIHRILKKGAYFFHMDITNGNKIIDSIFNKAVPIIAKIFYGENLPYKYLIKSKREFYNPFELSKIICKNGFKLIEEYRFIFDIITVQIFERL